MKVAIASLLLAGLGLAAATPASNSVHAQGEVVARDSAAIAPPTVDGLWMLNLTQLAADGASVRKGEVVAAFDAGDLATRLNEKQSKLKEKQTELASLQLDLAERERQSALDTEQARADFEKAQRKASEPKDLIAGNAYKKLVIGLQQARAKYALQQQRQQLQARQRSEELRLAQAEAGQLRGEVGTLLASIAALTVTAPRSGVMIHADDWNGGKIDVGSRVWRGQAVAQIPDLSSLQIRAWVAERELARLALGEPVQVGVDGGTGNSLDGRVVAIGQVVHSKSRSEPVPVVDVTIALSGRTASLRPGQPVSVTIDTTKVRR